MFKRIVVKLDRGQPVGKIGEGVLCVNAGDLTWGGGRLNWSGDELTEVFQQELHKANYEVVGDPDALFEDHSAWKAELLVAGLVKDLQANVCYPWAGYGNYSKAKGEAWMKVDWQIYSRLDREVIYETTTEGTGMAEKASNAAAQDIYFNAFSVATRNLLADKGFYELVSKTEESIADPLPETFTVQGISLYEGPLNTHINDVRAGVVTVYAGDGLGSGFFIGTGGYLLTNEHVVREAKFVKIKFVTGGEVVGEVVRTNKRRDVALVKTEPTQIHPLPVRLKDVGIAEEVYAIGSPLEFAGTVSKGIVSSIRDVEGQTVIQSDTNIQVGNSGGPLVDAMGNVVGISTWKIMPNGQETGLNFFVPISDAIEQLGISISR